MNFLIYSAANPVSKIVVELSKRFVLCIIWKLLLGEGKENFVYSYDADCFGKEKINALHSNIFVLL